MSENQRHSGGGAFFVLLLVVGFFVIFPEDAAKSCRRGIEAYP
jgi:hypothetical protein